MTEGTCKHGKFDLMKGCVQCIEERRNKYSPVTTDMPDAAAEQAFTPPEAKPPIVKVQYFSETTGELSTREYTYFSADKLSVGDIVIVPVRGTTTKAKVSAIDVAESEIAAFKDKVKTIPKGSAVVEEHHIKTTPADGFAYLHEVETAKMLADEESNPENSLVITRPESDTALMAFYAEALELKRYAEDRVITSLEDMKPANDDLNIIRRLKKLMEARRKEYLAPFREHVDEVNEAYKRLMAPVDIADKVTTDKMLSFNREQERIRREQEEINRLRMEAAQKDAALHNGEISEPVNLVEVIPEAPRHVSTEMGSSGMRDTWKWEVVDINQVPREYLMINAGMLTPVVKASKGKLVIPGIRIYNDPILATGR